MLHKIIVWAIGMAALVSIVHFAPSEAFWFIFGANLAGYIEGQIIQHISSWIVPGRPGT